MKKHYFVLALLIAAVGCTQDLEVMEPSEPAAMDDIMNAMPDIPVRNMENAVYNEVLDVWMMPRPYAYNIENFQKAYDNLKAGKSAQVLTKSQAVEFAVEKKLKPTHYALKIYPKNEDEQWDVEMMQDVTVLYIPFDYVQLTPQEVEKVTLTRSTFNTFTDKSPYTVTYKDYESTEGGLTGPRTFQLPILYAVWPVDKPLPGDLEYEIDHEIFQSRDATTQIGNSEALTILVNEAVSAARGVPAQTIKSTTNPTTRYYGEYVTLYAYVKSYDDVMGRNIPMPNLKVQYTVEEGAVGGWLSGTTIRDGSIAIETRIPYDTSGLEWYEIESFMVYYQDPAGKWKITTGNSTAPHSISMFVTLPAGRNAVLYPSEIIVPERDRQANQIWRGASYFFNNQTDFPKSSLSGGIQIIANSTSNRTPDGYIGGGFSHPTYGSSNPFIDIWNNSTPDADVTGSILHELGHFAHYNSNNSRYRNTLLFIKEAFSSYSGWYLTHEYYRSLGRTIYPDTDITAHGLYDGQGQQMWDKTSPRYYTPLLVDLSDNMNQRFFYGYFTPANFPNDNLGNAPASVIWNIITNSQDWTQCKQMIKSYAGTGTGKYYTATDYNAWIATFEEWLVTYPDYLTIL